MFRAMKRVFEYSGRSTRWEHWSFAIGLAIVLTVTGAWEANYQNEHFGLSPQPSDDQAAGVGFASLIFGAAPGLALKVRRYHDFGWSGWAVLWAFVPLVNLCTEVMLLFRRSTPEPVGYRPEPEARGITIYNTPSAIPAGPGRLGAEADADATRSPVSPTCTLRAC